MSDPKNVELHKISTRKLLDLLKRLPPIRK